MNPTVVATVPAHHLFIPPDSARTTLFLLFLSIIIKDFFRKGTTSFIKKQTFLKESICLYAESSEKILYAAPSEHTLNPNHAPS
jgi:hypothetical protein